MHKHASTNRFYRLVWSHVNACWVAVAEGSRGRGKSARVRSAAAALGGLLAMNGALAAAVPDALALPTGAQVVVGQVQVGTSGSTMTINQATAQAIINWQGFDIGSQAAVRFNQPSVDAVALNRVMGTDPSRIYGQLSSNGKVFLINANGVMFGASAQVNVGSLLASTLGLTDQQFLAGQYEFQGSGGEVSNEGSIRAAHGGFAALLGQKVGNSGTIATPGGTVAMAAGERIGMDLRGDGLITLQVARGALAAVVQNKGLIQADGGRVTLTASAADTLARSSVNNAGLIQARGFANDGGTIRLVGDVVHAGQLDASSSSAKGGAVELSGAAIALGGAVNVSGVTGGSATVAATQDLYVTAITDARGTLGQGGEVSYRAGGAMMETTGGGANVSGATDGGIVTVNADGGVLSSGTYAARGAAGAGGRIDVSGANVRLLSATLDASGVTQGGLVRVGGAFQGGQSGPQAAAFERFVGRWGTMAPVASASKTLINDASKIDVSASGAAGQGGTAVVWADDQTTMLGSLDARGATAGGAVEISGKNELRHVGLEKIAIGAGGQLLLDPKNITITPGGSEQWTNGAILGSGYGGGGNVDVAGLGDGDGFGTAIALGTDLLAIGAPGDDGFGDFSYDTGAVHLFSVSNDDFSNAAFLGVHGFNYYTNYNYNSADSLAASSRFGSSLSIKGNLLAVGAPGADNNYGAVYVFSSPGGGNLYNQQTIYGSNGNGYFNPQPGQNFGAAVSYATIGSELAIGSPQGENGGSVSLHDYGSIYNHFTNPDPYNYYDPSFGTSVAYFGNGYLAVGDPSANYDTGLVRIYNPANTGGSVLTALGPQYGGEKFGVSLAAIGNTSKLAVGTYNGSNGYTGTVRIFDDPLNNGSFSSIGQFTGNDPRDLNVSTYTADRFGVALAASASGDTLLVGSPGTASNYGYGSVGAVHTFQTPDIYSGALLFGQSPSNNVNLSGQALQYLLIQGTDVVLQANNDILIPHSGGNNFYYSGGGSGSLTLRAGRSIEINDTISIPGSIYVVANDTAANGVIDQYRDSGQAYISITQPVTSDSGNVSVVLADGAGRAYSESSVIALYSELKGTNITVHNDGPSSHSNIYFSAGATLTPSVEAKVIVGQNGDGGQYGIYNDSSSLLNGQSAGRLLVYSDTPLFGNANLPSFNKHYNEVYSASAPSYAASGNWLFYRLAPTLNVTSDNLSKIYDGNATAPALTYGATGFIDGDTLAGSMLGALSVTGLTRNAGVYNTAQGALTTKEGYLINFVPGTLTVTPKAIGPAIVANSGNRVYDQTTATTVQLSLPDAVTGDAVTVSGNAAFSTADAGTGKTLVVSGIALAGADKNNYSLTQTQLNTTGNITQRALDATAAGVNRVYDGSLSATVNLSSNALSGDEVLVSGTASFVDKHAGVGKTVTLGPITIGGAQGGNYFLQNFPLTTSATITARALDVLATGGAKTYDGDTATTVGLTDNRLTNDVLTVAANASFVDKNADVNKLVNVGLSLSGADQDNYYLTSSAVTSIATIAPRALDFSLAAQNKVYDGNNVALAAVGDNRVTNDQFTVSTGSVTFADKHAEGAKLVTAAGIGIQGADAGNYVLTSTNAQGYASITPRALNVTASGVSKTYDGTANASVTLTDDRIGGDQLSVSGSAVFSDSNAGVGRTVNVSNIAVLGADAGNYMPVAQTAMTAADIFQRALNVTLAGVDKIYDGLLDASVLFGDDRILGDALSLTGSASYANRSAGAGKSITVSGIALSGAQAGNYVLQSSTGATSASILARALSATATGVNKTYDGGSAASVAFADNRIAGDNLTVTGSATFADKNAGVGRAITVNGLAIGGADAGNYALAGSTASASADIAARLLTVTAGAASKTYDGSTAAAVTFGDDRVGGDVLTVTGNAAFNDKDVGLGKAVAVSGMTLSGQDAGNYALSSASGSTNASIAARALNAGFSGAAKTYDGTTLAAGAFTDDRVAGDVLNLSGKAVFGDKNAGMAKAINASGIVLSGADAGNYALAASTATGSADIAARSLTVGASGVDKVYDGTTSAVVALADDRIAGDMLSVSSTSSAFASKDVGTRAVAVAGLTLSGADSGNYTLASSSAAGAAKITAKALTASLTGATSKTYDGTVAAAIAAASVAVGGFVSGESASSGALAGSFDSADAGVAATVSASLSGASFAPAAGTLLSNYTLPSAVTGTGSIVPKIVSVTGMVAATKVYDGSTTASVASIGTVTGLVAGETLGLTRQGSASFDTRSAGTGKQVAATGYALTNGSGKASNYALASTTAVSGSGVIDKASLVVTADAKTRAAGAANPQFTFGVSGLVGGDSSALVASAVGASSADALSAAGNYPITLTGPQLADYQVGYVNGVLTVEGGAAPLPDPVTPLPDPAAPTLAAVATSFTALDSAGSNTPGAPFGVASASSTGEENADERAQPVVAVDEVRAAAPAAASTGMQGDVVTLRGGTNVVVKGRGVRLPK